MKHVRDRRDRGRLRLDPRWEEVEFTFPPHDPTPVEMPPAIGEFLANVSNGKVVI